MSTKKIRLGYWLITIYIVGPILVSLFSLVACWLLGYKPDEAGSKPYFVLDFNIGDLLASLCMAGIFSIFTIPSGLLALVFFRTFLKRKKANDFAA